MQHIYNSVTVPCEKSKTVSFASSRIKNVLVFPALSNYAEILDCWIALGSASNASCLLKFTAIIQSSYYFKTRII